MAGSDGKPKQPPGSGARPAAQAPKPGGGASAFDLPVVSGKNPFAAKEKTGGSAANPFGSQERTAGGSPKNPFSAQERTAGGTPKVATSQKELPKVASTGASAANLQTVGAVAARKGNANIQKHLESSAFDSHHGGKVEVLMGRARSVELDADEEGVSLNEFYDGETPAKVVSTKSTWRALKAPVRSKASRRSARTLWTLIDQFAVGNNLRYRVTSDLAEPRAHVFAWDVSMAMECEIPHYFKGREMTLMQTIDWLRFESSQHGWRRIDVNNALAAADRGELVIVISKEVKTRAMAVVRPGGAGDDGSPRVASAGRPMGNDLSITEAIPGLVDYYSHD